VRKCRQGGGEAAATLTGVDIGRLQEVTLSDADGVRHRLGDLWADRPVILVFLRHFG